MSALKQKILSAEKWLHIFHPMLVLPTLSFCYLLPRISDIPYGVLL